MRIVDVVTDDGVMLALRWFPARGARRAVVLAMHAMMVNGATLDRPRGKGFASRLAERGLETFVLDFRGHGLSERPRRGWTLDDYARFDLPAALRGIEAVCGARPHEIAWIGHSLGGLVSLAALSSEAAPSPRSLVLATTNIWRHPPLLRRAFIELFDGSARLLGRAPIRAVGMGTDDEPASYTSHLASFVRTARFRSADGAIDYDEGLPRVKLPVLSIIGTGDILCRVPEARDLTRRMTSATHQELIIPAATHFTIWRSPLVLERVSAFIDTAQLPR